MVGHYLMFGCIVCFQEGEVEEVMEEAGTMEVDSREGK